MPRSIREMALRKLEQAHNDIDRTGQNLHWIVETYQEQHPEIAANFEILLAALLEFDGAVTKASEAI